MRNALAALVACGLLAACTVTNVQTAPKDLISSSTNAKIVLVDPDVQLSLLTASGILEDRADWSQQGHDDLLKAMRDSLEAKNHHSELVTTADLQAGQAGQLARLHQAVGQMITTYGPVLPTKKGKFDWTLGDGAKALGAKSGADYALFVTARGSYASGGRFAMMLGAAALGVSIPLGSQTVFASLVDLKTGQVVWFNTALAGPNDDMRSPQGGLSLTQTLLKSAPL